jgi:hypothetical protein
MPRSASTGVYTAPSNSFNPAVTDTVISSTAWNAQLADYVTALGHTASTTRALYPTTGQVQDGGFLWGGTAGGTADALTITLSPAITAYAAGMRFRFILSASANTGSGVTLAVNGLTAHTIRRRDNTSLSAGDLAPNALIDVTYDGTVFRINGLVASQVATNIPRSSRTSNTLLGVNDKGSIVSISSGTFTQTFDRTATLGDGWWLYYQNLGLGTITARSVGGADSILNGGFSSTANWVTGIGWTISAGVANGSVTNASLSQTQTLTAGQVYRLTYTVTRSAGTVTPRFTGGTTVTGTARSTAATFEEYITAVAGNTTIEFLGAGFTGTIDNVSMVPIDVLDGLNEYNIYPGETRLFQCNGVNLVSVVISAFYLPLSASATFVTPPGYVGFDVTAIGAGGGGGSGRRDAAGTTRVGGAAGGGGAYKRDLVAASSLTATVSVTVGAGGTGGAAQTVDATNGNPGITGGNSSFGTFVVAYAGSFGEGGTAATPLGGGGGGGLSAASGTTGGQPQIIGAQAQQFGGGNSTSPDAQCSGSGGGAGGAAGNTGGGSVLGGAGGGEGGSINTANTVADGRAGGSNSARNGGGGAAGTSGDTSSTVGAAGTGRSGGGGGGSRRSAGAASAGGAGGVGAGGGGGGASENGINSGAGGAGGNGFVGIVGVQ